MVCTLTSTIHYKDIVRIWVYFAGGERYNGRLPQEASAGQIYPQVETHPANKHLTHHQDNAILTSIQTVPLHMDDSYYTNLLSPWLILYYKLWTLS